MYFDCANFGGLNLGHIVENGVVQGAAIAALCNYDNLILQCPEPIQSISTLATIGARVVTLGSGKELCTRLVIGADGGNSHSRCAVALATREWDYRRSTIVASVKTENTHRDTAWQSFIPSGPLALLPLLMFHDAHLYSLMWS